MATMSWTLVGRTCMGISVAGVLCIVLGIFARMNCIAAGVSFGSNRTIPQFRARIHRTHIGVQYLAQSWISGHSDVLSGKPRMSMIPATLSYQLHKMPLLNEGHVEPTISRVDQCC